MLESASNLPDFGSEPASINLDMTPLIDCIFQLLVFFMITSTFAKPAIDLQLPSLDTAATPTKPTELRISVSAEGEVSLNGKPTSIQLLGTSLATAAQDGSKPAVYFQADANAPYEVFLEVAEEVRSLGISHFNLVHERKN